MVLEHGTYSQKINQNNNLAGHNDDKPWQRAKFCHQHGFFYRPKYPDISDISCLSLGADKN
jgi:hypothetical protein